VKTTCLLGGNPVLAEAADAAAGWKFEAAANETTEVVQLLFVGQ
jgi:hypothetical protein